VRGAALALALALAGAPTDAAGDGPALDPRRLRWSELRFVARKLVFTAETTVRAEVLPAGAVGMLAAIPGHAALAPAGELLARVEVDTRLLGRHTHNGAVLDAASGAALQASSREFGRRARVKVQRFAADGVSVQRARPAPGEERRPPEAWSRRSEEFLAFPAAAPEAGVATDSVALFWLLATGPPALPGESLAVRLLSGGRPLAVTIRALATRNVRLELVERRPGGARRVVETIAALDLLVDAAQGAAADPDDELEFLGMRGGVRILLDPVRGVPVEVSGRVPSAGAITVRLQEATLRD